MNEHIIPPMGNMPPKKGSTNNPEPITNNENINELYEKIQTKYGEVDIKKNFNPFRFRNNVEPLLGGIPVIFLTTPQMNIFQTETDRNQSSRANVAGALSMITNLGNPTTVTNVTKNFNHDVWRTITGKSNEQEEFEIPTEICEDLKMMNNNVFEYYNSTDPELVKALTYGESAGGTSSPWIKFLSNLFKGITLNDITLRTIEDYETFYGWKQILPGPNTDSYTAGQLNVNYEETKNLDVIKFHFLWTQYIEAVRYGIHSPSNQMRNRRTIDYTSSLYYFLLDFDMSKILYGCKYTGIYPISVPTSALATGDITTKNPIDASITYAYQHKEDLTNSIIFDFNSVGKFAHKVVAYGRSNLIDNNVDDNSTAETLKEEYGWGDISKRSSGKFDIDFTNEKNRSFNKVEIKMIKNSTYDSKNKTAFASDTNLNRISFHLIFTNGKDLSYGEDDDVENEDDINNVWLGSTTSSNSNDNSDNTTDFAKNTPTNKESLIDKVWDSVNNNVRDKIDNTKEDIKDIPIVGGIIKDFL